MNIRLSWALLLSTAAFAWQNSSPGDWPMYNRDYASTRFSQLAQITPKNVASLHPVCSYVLPEPAVEFESSLVAVSGTLYFTTFEYTYAVDASTCALKWRVKHQLPEPYGLVGTTRGVALLGNRVFRGFRDGYVIAYSSKNGEQLWTTKLKTPDGVDATIAASPIAWNGMVFIGTSGAEQACQCEIAALDANTGKILWTFALIPTGNAPGADSWPKGTRTGGGSNWTSLSLDTDSGALYIPTGNPGPDFSGEYRPGSNLYSGSIVVLDAKSGALRTWYQLVPHDVHDWDQAATPALITTKSGQRRAMAAGKDGFLHSIDVTAGKIAWKTPVTTIENIDAPLTPEGTHFCPGTTGGVTWNGPAYSAGTNLVYVNSIDRCSTLKMDTKLPTFEPGKAFLGSANAFGIKDSRNLGWLTAVDADSGAIRWRYQAATPMVAGIVATASGLVLTADLNGDLLAFDAATGNLLHRISTKQPAGGGVITYQTGAQQRIAIATGLNSSIFETKGQPQVVIFGL